MAHEVDVWLGQFSSGESRETYFAEHFDRPDDHPISAFAADQLAIFVDHDFFEVCPMEDPGRDLGETLRSASWGEAYAAQVLDRLAGPDTPTGNTLVLSFDGAVPAPRSCAGDGYALHYVGRFRFDEHRRVGGKGLPAEDEETAS